MSDIRHITAPELAARMHGDSPPKILDVRERWELDIVKLNDTINIPMAQIPEHLGELKNSQGDGDLIVMCHSGKRSAVITNYLQQNGFERVINLEGGIQGWATQVDQNLPVY